MPSKSGERDGELVTMDEKFWEGLWFGKRVEKLAWLDAGARRRPLNGRAFRVVAIIGFSIVWPQLWKLGEDTPRDLESASMYFSSKEWSFSEDIDNVNSCLCLRREIGASRARRKRVRGFSFSSSSLADAAFFEARVGGLDELASFLFRWDAMVEMCLMVNDDLVRAKNYW